ncbi:MAG: YbaN family protein [Culturomica sp.]|nr:YbaN family protein [Culturomica sp.]
MYKVLYIFIGCISLALGILGIFVPGLPTTPFLLLSSWLFYKSSKRLHDALHRSKWLGAYIRRYESGEGVGRTSKVVSILMMWIMISISAFCFIENVKIRILLFVLGIIGTASVIYFVPSRKKNQSNEE